MHAHTKANQAYTLNPPVIAKCGECMDKRFMMIQHYVEQSKAWENNWLKSQHGIICYENNQILEKFSCVSTEFPGLTLTLVHSSRNMLKSFWSSRFCKPLFQENVNFS